MTIIKKQGTPEFTPDMPEECILGRDAVSRDFFMHKSTIYKLNIDS